MRTLARFCVVLTMVLMIGVVYWSFQSSRAQSNCATQPKGAVAWYPGDGNKSVTTKEKADAHAARSGVSRACTQSGTSAASSQSGESSPGANASAAASKLSGVLSLARHFEDGGTDGFAHYLRSGLETRLTVGGFVSSSNPVRLSPDGTQVVFAARSARGDIDIFVANSDGSNPVNVTNHRPVCQNPNSGCSYDGQPAWSPDGRHIVFMRAADASISYNEIFVMKADGSKVQKLLSSHIRPIERHSFFTAFPTWSPDGTKIVYSFEHFSDETSGVDIAVLSLDRQPDADGDDIFNVTSDVRLTSTTTVNYRPMWSPDGSKIAFERDSGTSAFGDYDVYVMKADGSNVVNLTNNPANSETHPVWSPDGSKIIFSKYFDPEIPHPTNGASIKRIHVMNADGSNPTPVETGGNRDFAWSWIDPCGAPPPQPNAAVESTAPKGKAEGYATRPGVSRACTQSGTSAASSQSGESSPGANASVAASSLRGTLSLHGFDFEEGDDTISTYNLPAKLETVVRHPRANGRVSEPRPRLSPDGEKIVYAETGPDGFNDDVYVMNADGSNPVNLSNYPSDPGEIYNCRFGRPNDSHSNKERCRDTWPAWSPDGEHIAFISGRNGRDELYVMDAAGANLRLLPSRLSSAPNNEAGYYGQPVWSPDGSKIVYSYPTEYVTSSGVTYPRRSDIAVLSLERDATGNFVVTSDVQLTSHPLFDLAPAWSPDGSKIAFHRYYQSNIFENSPSLDVYVMNADGSNQVNLTNTTDRFEYLPVWSPDGSKIAFTSEIPDPDRSLGGVFFNPTQLIVLDLNSSSLTRIETHAPIVHAYSWIDPCTASTPLGGAAKASASQSKSAAPVKASKSDGLAAPTAFKCIKEIVVNVTTDDPDTDTTDEFCDTDANRIGNQCSLRAAIQEANARPGLDFITFDIPGDGLHTIAPTSELPDITGQVAIDATTQPGYADNAPVVELSGAAAGAANGFNVRAKGVRIAGLVINRFAKNGVTDKGNGIFALDTTGLFLHSCFIGTDATGTTAAPNDVGVLLRNTINSTIGGNLDSFGNLISGNGFGVSILGAESIPRGDNSVIGNRIGVDRTGANALGNKSAGVIVIASTHNQIGGDTNATGTAPGNLISGDNSSTGAGVFLLGAKYTTVAGNLIGTDATGKKGFGNGVGIYLSTESTNNTIGGYSTQARNVISGNKFGIDLFGPGVNDNLILNNYVGTDITGRAIVPIAGVPDYPQQRRGITVEGGSRNQIGSGSDTRNVVAGNAEIQIGVLRPEATNNQITGNYVGLFADGNTSPTNDSREIGIWIFGATKTIVGDGDANVISGNGLGVLISNPTNHLSAQNQLLYNYIGTNAAGTAARPNASGGVLITKSSNNTIEGNIISGNSGAGGITLANDLAQPTSSAAPASSKSFAAAFPANASKISAASALSDAVALLRERGATAARQDTGGSVAQAEEVTAETKNNVLIVNYIGTNPNGDAAIPNATAGVFIGPGANENIIGKPNDGNIISGNNGAGVLIGNSEQSTKSPTGNKIQGNIIGLNEDAMAKVPNTKQGIGILFGAGTIIGGDTENAGNVIAGNGESGIAILGTSNTVRFNFVGTNRNGAPDLGNAGDGIKLENVAGLENTVADNTIGGNGSVGINIVGSAQTPPPPESASKRAGVRRADIGDLLTKIGGNTIGVVKVVNGGNTVAVKLANLLGGVKITDTFNVAVTNQVGSGPNIIAGNNGPGVLIEGQNASGNIVEGAIIGTDEQGTSGLGNAGDGVRIVNAPGNFVGGENKPGAARRGNVIAGNAGNGISVEGGNAGGNAVQGNLVGVVNANGSVIKKGNGFLGIKINLAPATLVGLPAGLGGVVKEQLGNVVAGNGGGGLLLQNANGTRVSGNAVGTDHAGASDLGNGGPGVLMTAGTSNTVVGGPEENSGNTITGNDGSGVRIDETGGEGNLIDPNSIFNNKGYGIDLGRRGVTPNDFGDADVGPNRLQNYPEITAVGVNDAGQLVVSYRLTSSPQHSSYGTLGLYVEFFKADRRGQGQKFLGSDHYTEADFNNGSPVVKQVTLGALAALGIDADDPITATASDAGGNTSEFSPPYSTRTLVVTKTDDTDDGTCDSDCSLREALAVADAGNEIGFAVSLFDTAQTITLGGTELVVSKSVTITGKGAHLLTVSANNLSRVFNVQDGAIVTLRGLTITKGNALGNFIGGGILNAGTLTLIETHVTDNIADRGAGLYNTGTLFMQASTVSANKANLGSATPAGGGIHSEGGGLLTVINSTISGNEARAADAAGGLYIVDGTATITASTITKNSASQGASNAGGIKNKDGAVAIGNTIIAANTAASPDLAGAFASSGYNLVGKNDGAAASFPAGNPVGAPNNQHDLVGISSAPVDPQLDALGDYGGTTPTHRLQANSPAIDKGLSFGLTTDQRGLPRPSDDTATPNASGGDSSDIGAFEAQFAPPALATISGQVTFGGSPLAGVTLALTRPDNSTATTTTGSDGLYSFTALAAGSYTVTPARPRFTFTPQSRTVSVSGTDVTNQNFEAASTASNPQPANGSVLISEFRLSGATADDEFIELYNNTNAPVDISGYLIDALAGFTLTIPADTVLPARAHYLIAHQTGYSLSAYATPNLTYSGFDLPADTGLALFNAANVIVDAVGFNTSALPYREGTGLVPISSQAQYSFVRQTIAGAGLPNTGRPQDTGDNAADFLLVAIDPSLITNALAALGTPGPENLSSPIQRNAQVRATLVDPTQGQAGANNRFRDRTPVPNGAIGTLSIRRTYTNLTGQNITRLRFRIIDITTLNSPGYSLCPDPNNCSQAEVRALSSTDITVRRADGSEVQVRGTRIETPPGQDSGGGLNTSLSVGSITLETPLMPNAAVSVQFLLGVQQSGAFRLLVNVEALP